MTKKGWLVIIPVLVLVITAIVLVLYFNKTEEKKKPDDKPPHQPEKPPRKPKKPKIPGYERGTWKFTVKKIEELYISEDYRGGQEGIWFVYGRNFSKLSDYLEGLNEGFSDYLKKRKKDYHIAILFDYVYSRKWKDILKYFDYKSKDWDRYYDLTPKQGANNLIFEFRNLEYTLKNNKITRVEFDDGVEIIWPPLPTKPDLQNFATLDDIHGNGLRNIATLDDLYGNGLRNLATLADLADWRQSKKKEERNNGRNR